MRLSMEFSIDSQLVGIASNISIVTAAILCRIQLRATNEACNERIKPTNVELDKSRIESGHVSS